MRLKRSLLLSFMLIAVTLSFEKKAETQLTSSGDWKRIITTGKQVSVSVLNTDGVRSTTISFLR